MRTLSLAGFPKFAENCIPVGAAFVEHYRTSFLDEAASNMDLTLPELEADPTAIGTIGENLNFSGAAREVQSKKDRNRKRPAGSRDGELVAYHGLASTKRGQDMPDPYESLALIPKRWRSTEAEIEAAYKVRILVTHPDKNGTGDDKMFVAVQDSYELLMDLERRRAYDSQYDVNDALPEVAEIKGANFYTVMGACIERNARWSVIQPTPKLGDANTPMDEVDAFYAFFRYVR